MQAIIHKLMLPREEFGFIYEHNMNNLYVYSLVQKVSGAHKLGAVSQGCMQAKARQLCITRL